MSKQSNQRQQEAAEAYIKEHISRCPLCKQAHTEWTFEHMAFLQDKRVHFQCPSCECRLSAAYGEMKGVSGSGVADFLKGAASYDAMVRSVYGKKKGVTYIRIMNPGTTREAWDLKDREIPLDELKEMFW